MSVQDLFNVSKALVFCCRFCRPIVPAKRVLSRSGWPDRILFFVVEHYFVDGGVFLFRRDPY